MDRGRPTTYKEEYKDTVYRLCLLGATDVEIAEILGCSESTLNLWKKDHEDFSESIKNGKMVADSKVAESLYKRAIGYEHFEDQIFQYQGDPVIVPTTKHYPPDTGAAMAWLKNRRPKDWRDRQDLQLTGKDGNDLTINIVNASGAKKDGKNNSD